MDVIKQIVALHGEKRFPQAMRCLRILRETCRTEDEAMTFNDFMFQLRDLCLMEIPRMCKPFWMLVKNEKISLITRDETVDPKIAIEENEAIEVIIFSNDCLTVTSFWMNFSTYIRWMQRSTIEEKPYTE